MKSMFRRKVGSGPYSTRIGRKIGIGKELFLGLFNLSVVAQRQKLEKLKEACENKPLQG
jgi:hypothetical protein